MTARLAEERRVRAGSQRSASVSKARRRGDDADGRRPRAQDALTDKREADRGECCGEADGGQDGQKHGDMSSEIWDARYYSKWRIKNLQRAAESVASLDPA
jgi:hypothetical protein